MKKRGLIIFSVFTFIVASVFAYTTICSNCRGSGKQNCDRCFGRGREICFECFGTGSCGTQFDEKGYIVEGPPCSYCYGKGTKECRYCNGKGIYNCPICHGTGSVESQY